MRMMIRYKNKLQVEAVLLAADSEQMRVAVASERDAVVLQRVDTYWYTETGAAIEIEALIPIEGTDFSQFCASVHPQTTVVGRAFAAA